MQTHQNILVALDISDEALLILAKAKELAGFYKAGLHLIHVLEPIAPDTPFELGPNLPLDTDIIRRERAQNFLQQVAGKAGVEQASHSVLIGSVKHNIFQAVKDKNIGLVVIGTHGRHGVGLLLGSTAASVLHGTPCDVYAVRLK